MQAACETAEKADTEETMRRQPLLGALVFALAFGCNTSGSGLMVESGDGGGTSSDGPQASDAPAGSTGGSGGGGMPGTGGSAGAGGAGTVGPCGGGCPAGQACLGGSP